MRNKREIGRKTQDVDWNYHGRFVGDILSRFIDIVLPTLSLAWNLHAINAYNALY